MANNAPLTGGDLKTINDTLRQLHDYVPHLEKMKAVGIDTTQLEQMHQYYLQKFLAYKQHYYPHN